MQSSASTASSTVRQSTAQKSEDETKYYTTPTEFTTTTTFESEISTFESDYMDSKCKVKEPEIKITDEDLVRLEEDEKEELRNLCWETWFGQELTKMTVMELMMMIASTVVMDFLRAVFVRY